MKKYLSIVCAVFALLLCLCMLTACGDQAEVTESTVTEVTVNKKGTEISVKAVLTESDLESFKNTEIYNKQLYLLALEPGDTLADAAGKQPVAETNMSTTPKFKVNLYADGEMQAHSRLHCAFAVAAYNKTLSSYVLLTTPVYISNVADLAQNENDFPSAASIKGLHTAISSDAAYLGVAHTVIELDPSLLILDSYGERALSYVYDGQTYYLDRVLLDKLDKQVSEATAQGSIVYFRLRMHTAPDKANSLVSCLYADGVAAKEGRTYAIWMDDDKSASLMAGFLDFITARYTDPASTHGFCGALIIGRSVNEATQNNNAGSAPLEDYVDRYHALVRLAHSTLKSHYANGRVFLSVSNNLSDYDKVKPDSTTYSFLDSFYAKSLQSGDFDWHVAISAYHYKNSDKLWSDDHATSQYLSPTHFSDFMWIAQSDHYYEGERRHTIISDFEVAPLDNQNLQAASYAYAYYKVLENGTVDALIYSAHTDKQSLIDGSGLWMTDKNGLVTERRTLYNVFLTIDTKDVSVLNDIGISSLIQSWNTLYDAQSAKAATRQFVTDANDEDANDEDDQEKPSGKNKLFFDFTGGTTAGFMPDESIAYLELTKSPELGHPVLSAHLDRKQPLTYMGISNTALQGSELKGVNQIVLRLCAAANTETPINIKLRLIKQGDSTLSAGNQSIVYEDIAQIAPNTWTDLAFDVSEFSKLVDGDDRITVSVQIMVPELAEEGSCTLLLDRVVAYGKFGVRFYEWIIIIVSILAVLALVVGLVYLLYRKYGAPHIIANIFYNISKGKIKLRRSKKAKR